jgi:hypothetical protein
MESTQRGGHPSRAQVSGPLAAFAGAFGEALAGKGYSARSAGELMRLTAKLSGWLQSRDLGAVDVTAAVIEEFFAERRRDGCARWRTSRSLALLAECMGIAPGGRAVGLLARYRDYLLAERGLAASTTDRYLRLAAAFLAWLPGGEQGVAGLGAGQGAGVLTRKAGGTSRMSREARGRICKGRGLKCPRLLGIAQFTTARHRGRRIRPPRARSRSRPVAVAPDRRSGRAVRPATDQPPDRPRRVDRRERPLPAPGRGTWRCIELLEGSPLGRHR